MQCQPQKNDKEIIFGSLDLETLRSVGIFSTKLTEIHSPNGSDHSVPDNAPNKMLPSDSRSKSVSEAAAVERNGCSSSIICLGDSGLKQLKPVKIDGHASVGSDSAHNLSKYSTTELPDINGVSELSSSENGIQQVDSKWSTYKDSSCPKPIRRNFLPRGLVNLGNLCFLNASLQALLSCSPFLELLHELRNRDIPEVACRINFYCILK